MPSTVLGIDAGATKTVCVLADEEGRVLSEARGGSANLAIDGELKVEKVLHGVIEEVQRPGDQAPAALCLGIAGVDRPEEASIALAIIRRLGHRERTIIVNDALLALTAGAGVAPGIVVISGTGSIVYGRNGSGEAARSGGWGHLLADEGSGYWIGLQALRAVMRERDGRGPATSLTAAVLKHFLLHTASDLVRVVYYQDLHRQDIAALTEIVEQCSRAGDDVATNILGRAAVELANAASSVIRHLKLERQEFICVLSGGVFHGAPSLAGTLDTFLKDIAPRVFVKLLEVEPAVGAARLAIELLKGSLVLPVYAQ